MEQLKLYVKESYNELINKVTWPTFPSLYNTTIVVMIATVLLTLVIFLMNIASKGILDLVYNL